MNGPERTLAAGVRRIVWASAVMFAGIAGADVADVEVTQAQVGELMEAGAYEEAIATARRFTEDHPDSAALWSSLGEALLATGQIEQAEQAFTRAITEEADDRLTAELNLAVIRYRRGEHSEAFAGFERVLDYYRAQRGYYGSRDLTAVAAAAAYTGITRPAMYKGAVRLYTHAITLDPGNVDARLALGNLLLDKYNNTEAREVFEEVLEDHPGHPQALLGLARSQHFDHSAEAMVTVEAALEANPNLVPAHVFVARLHIESEQYEAAKAAADKALETNPASLEALTMLAAVHYLMLDGEAYEATKQRLFAINPRYAELYNTLTELAAQNRLYADAVELARKAVALDPRSWRGYGLLGMNQLRIGEIEAGRVNLDKAFTADPYNVWIKNTLDLTDTFVEYEQAVEGRFELMVHRDEAGVLKPYLHHLAEQVFDDFVQRYQFEPHTPMRIELYPRHADFSVRTVGLAGLGLLGVSFGPVVAMDSPSARGRQHFNWGSTLRHELAHSFHMGMTDSRVPRWFSEGLAVHEERRGLEGWGADVTPSFLIALRDGRLAPVSSLNDSFVRPSYPEQVIHAYYQASLVLELIEREWGFDAVRAMMAMYKQGHSSAEAIEEVLGLEPEAFDARFETFLQERFEKPLAAFPAGAAGERAPPRSPQEMIELAERELGDFVVQLRTGLVLRAMGDDEAAEPFLLRARDLFPEYAGADGPYWHLAQLYLERGQSERAERALSAMVAINAEHYESHVALAALRDTSGDKRGAARVLHRAVYINPFEISLHEKLAELHAELGEWEAAARARESVVALGPVDMADAHFRLAEARLRAGERGGARRAVLRALEIAPGFEAAQDLLLEIRSRN